MSDQEPMGLHVPLSDEYSPDDIEDWADNEPDDPWAERYQPYD